MPLNSTYWAPVDAHDPVRVQQIMLGLTKSSAEKMDLALARDTKICKFFCCPMPYLHFLKLSFNDSFDNLIYGGPTVRCLCSKPLR